MRLGAFAKGVALRLPPRELTARYSGCVRRRFYLTVEDHQAHRSVDEYEAGKATALGFPATWAAFVANRFPVRHVSETAINRLEAVLPGSQRLRVNHKNRRFI